MDLLQQDTLDTSSSPSTASSIALNIGVCRQSRVSSVINPNYEQVSVREIVSRFKDKSHKRRKSLKLEDELSSVSKDANERTEYYLEAPKTGLLDENEIIQPIFLPTACESVNVEPELQTAETTKPFSGKNLEEIRNLVYCKDCTVVDEYQERLRKKGAMVKQHFGLTFESNFECGNLFQAESVVKKGAALGAPEEYDLFLRRDPSSHTVLYPPCVQWFFFRIENTKKRLYRFNIHFFTNGKIAYADGKRPMMISEADFNGMDKEGWKPCGTDITYEESFQRPLMYKCREEFPILDGPLRPQLFKLSFTVAIKQPKDTVYFAYEIPYTFTQLQNFIYVLSKNPFNRKHLQIRTLCRSLGGNRTDILVITEDSQLSRQELLERDENGEVVTVPYSIKDILPSAISAASGASVVASTVAGGALLHHSHLHQPGSSSSNISSVTSASYTTTGTRNTHIHSSQQPPPQQESSDPKPDTPVIPRFLMKMQTEIEEQREKDRRMRIERARKPAVVIFGRLHPNETCTSWMCEGIIRFLLGENITAKLLRERFVFYIVPMVNIDGVVNGYARHDIAGYDLATQWANPSPVLHSALFGIKYILRKLQATTKIAGFFDLRGHSHRSGFSFHSQLSSNRKTHLSTAAHSQNNNSQSNSKNNNSLNNTDPENFDPRMFYYAAARRCKNISLKHCHVIRHIPHYLPPQSQQHHIGEHHHNLLHDDYHRCSSHHSLQGDPYKGEWWKSKDATARMVMTHQLQVGLSVTVEASTYRSATPSTHMKEVKYLSPKDYAVFGSQLCLSLIDIYLSKESDVQMRLSNSSFIINSSGGAAAVRNNAQQLHNMAEILQHLPAMLDQVNELDELDSPKKDESSPYETATVDPARRGRRPRYRNSAMNRISFHIGSSDVDDHLKRLSNEESSSTDDGTLTDKKRKSETIELDDNDMQRVDYFNEDLWEHDSQASSDADGDHGDVKWLLYREGEEKLNTPTNRFSHLQKQQQHQYHNANDSDNIYKLNYLFFQSNDVVQRTLPHAIEEVEYPPVRWLNIRRAEYLGLIAPRINGENENDKNNSKQGEHGDDHDESIKKSSMTALQLTTTEHVFRMGPATSSFKPVKVMAHSDRLVAAIAEKQHIQQQIQHQLQQSADLTSLSSLPVQEDQPSATLSQSSAAKSRRNTTVFDDEDDGGNGNKDGNDEDSENEGVSKGRRSKNNKRQDNSKGGRNTKKSLIQFSYSKSSMRRNIEKAAESAPADGISSEQNYVKTDGDASKTADAEDENNLLTHALSAKAAMQRVGPLRHQRKSTLSGFNANSIDANMAVDNKPASPHLIPKGSRSTIAVIPSTASCNQDNMVTDNTVVDLPGISPIPPSSMDNREKDKQPSFRRRTTIGSATVPIMATPTTTIGSSNGALSLAPVTNVNPEPRPKLFTTVVLQRVPIINEEPSLDDTDSVAIVNMSSEEPSSSKFKPKQCVRKGSMVNVQQREKDKILTIDKTPNIPSAKLTKVKQENVNSKREGIIEPNGSNQNAKNINFDTFIAQSVDNLLLASSDGDVVPTEAHVKFTSAVDLKNEKTNALKQSPSLSTKQQLPPESSSFTKQLTQIIKKAVTENPAPAFAPTTTVPYVSPIEMAATVVAQKHLDPCEVIPSVDNSTLITAAVPQNLLSFADVPAQLSSIIEPSKPSEIDATENEICLATTTFSIACSAYSGELPAGYTPQKRRGQRTSTIMGPQYNEIDSESSTPTNNKALDSAITVKQLPEQQNITEIETAFKPSIVLQTNNTPSKELVIQDYPPALSTEIHSIALVNTIVNEVNISSTEPFSKLLKVNTTVPTSPDLLPPKKEAKKSVKNPLLQNSYEPPFYESNSVDATTVPTVESNMDELVSNDAMYFGEAGLPPLPSLANLSDEQLQHAIELASLKQKEQLQEREEAAATSAKVLPLISTSAYLPIPFVHNALSTIETSHDEYKILKEASKLQVNASSIGDDDEEVENRLAMLGRDINRTMPPSSLVHSNWQPSSSRKASRQGQQQLQKLFPLGFMMDDEDDDFDMDDEDENAYVYDPHHSRGGTVHSRGEMPISSFSSAAASRSHRKGHVQIIREYLQDHFEEDTVADNRMFFTTEVNNTTSPRSEGNSPFDCTSMNEVNQRVHFFTNHDLLDQLQYQSKGEKQASLVAAHHYKPLSKALTVSFIPPTMKKLSDAEFEEKYQREAEQKCLRELGLTYNYVFGGMDSLKNRTLPSIALNKTNALNSTNLPTKPGPPRNNANNTILSSQVSLFTNNFQKSSTNLTNNISHLIPTISSIDNSRPLGPAGTFHKGFPQRGGAGRRYELSYATDSAAYRLHAYYQHILQELKRRKLVPKDILEATATQLFEAVLTDPLHRQQVPVKISPSYEHESLPFLHTSKGAMPSEAAANMDATGHMQPISMSLSLQIVPPAKQLTPYRRFIKRPQIVNCGSKDDHASATTDGGIGVPKSKHLLKSREPISEETEEMNKSRLLQERLEKIAFSQEKQSRMIEKEKEKCLSDSFLDNENDNSVLPEWLSLSPHLHQQYFVGQSTMQRSAETKDKNKTNTSKFSSFKTEEKNAEFLQEEKEQEGQDNHEEKNETNKMLFDDENDQDLHASTEVTEETISPTADQQDMVELLQKKTNKQKNNSTTKKTPAKIQNVQIFSDYDVLVPPEQLSSPREGTTAPNGNAIDPFQEKIRKRLLSKFRAHQQQQQQFALDRSMAAIEAAKRLDFDAKLWLVCGENPHQEGNDNDSDDKYDTDDGNDDEKHAMTVKSLLNQQEYLSTGEASLVPAKKLLVNNYGRVSPVSAKMIKSGNNLSPSQNAKQYLNFSNKSPVMTQKNSPRNAPMGACAWLYQNGGKSFWDITHEPLATSVPGENANNSNAPSAAVAAAMDAVKAAVSPVKMSVAPLKFMDPSNHSNTSSRGLSQSSNIDYDASGKANEPGEVGEDPPSTSATHRTMQSGGSDKPMSLLVNMPPAQCEARTPPANKIIDNTFESTPISNHSNLATQNQEDHILHLEQEAIVFSPRISDIQRLTAAVTTTEKVASNENTEEDTEGNVESSAVALEVAARRPGGKKILLVQKQVVHTAPLLSSPFFSSSKSKRTSISMHTYLQEDGEDAISRSSGKYQKMAQSCSGEYTQTYRVIKDSGMGSKTSTIIRAASSLDSTEKERIRAGAIGRLLIGSKDTNKTAPQQPVRPSVPRPSQTTTTTDIAGTMDCKSDNVDKKRANVKLAIKHSKQQKQHAQHVIEELRQINVAKL